MFDFELINFSFEVPMTLRHLRIFINCRHHRFEIQTDALDGFFFLGVPRALGHASINQVVARIVTVG